MKTIRARQAVPLPDKNKPLEKSVSWLIIAWMAAAGLVLAGQGWAAIITNGDFSSSSDYGFTGWTLGGLTVPVTVTAQYHAAPPSAQVDDQEDALWGDSWMEQVFTLPADCTIATLTAYCRFFSGNTTTGIEWHYQAPVVYYGGGPLPNAGARILDAAGTPVALPPAPTPMRVNLNSDPQWWQYGYNLQPYSGQTLRVQFKAEDDAHGDPIGMWVDDVQVFCITATPTPTRTHSPTFTVSPTSTMTPTITPTPTISATYTVTGTHTATCSPTPILVAVGKSLVFPNPAPAAGKKLNFMYSLEAAGSVRIEVYNLLGYRVAAVEDKYQPAGWNLVTTWNYGNLAPGVYFYRLFCRTTDGKTQEYKKQKFVIAP